MLDHILLQTAVSFRLEPDPGGCLMRAPAALQVGATVPSHGWRKLGAQMGPHGRSEPQTPVQASPHAHPPSCALPLALQQERPVADVCHLCPEAHQLRETSELWVRIGEWSPSGRLVPVLPPPLREREAHRGGAVAEETPGSCRAASGPPSGEQAQAGGHPRARTTQGPTRPWTSLILQGCLSPGAAWGALNFKLYFH